MGKVHALDVVAEFTVKISDEGKVETSLTYPSTDYEKRVYATELLCVELRRVLSELDESEHSA